MLSVQTNPRMWNLIACPNSFLLHSPGIHFSCHSFLSMPGCMHRWPAEKADATTHKMEEETLLDQTEWMICHAWSSCTSTHAVCSISNGIRIDIFMWEFIFHYDWSSVFHMNFILHEFSKKIQHSSFFSENTIYF